MFKELQQIILKPMPFAFYTADRLWTDPHISRKMLEYHLRKDTVLASREPDFIQKSIQWLIEFFNIGNGTKLADFGCGPGLYTNPLAGTGASVTGIDFSRNSIEYAQKIATQNNLDVEYLNVNYLELKSEKKFDLISMVYCDYSALSPEQRARLLNIFHMHLKDGGKVVLDVWSRQFFNSIQEELSFDYVEKDGFWAPGPHFVFSAIHKYFTENLYLEKFTIYEEKQVNKVYNWLQSFTPEELTTEFVSNGFAILDFFSNIAGDPFSDESKEIAVVAKKI